MKVPFTTADFLDRAAAVYPLRTGVVDEPTNNLDPASRAEILSALATYKGSVVLVTHDEGAVEALQPDKVLLLPDGVEDTWNDDFADLVALA